jgi:RimJ/RimL family protein N-acetyltransferase
VTLVVHVDVLVPGAFGSCARRAGLLPNQERRGAGGSQAGMRRIFNDRTGRPILIREVTESDAARMVRLMHTLLDETPFMLRLPHEQRETPAEESRYLRHLRASGNSVALFAEDDGFPCATLIVTGGGLARLAHVGYLGMGVLRRYWRAGIGRAILDAAIDWARDHELIRKLSLQVFDTNVRAVQLYHSVGFVEEGRLRDEVHEDGEFVDMLQMALFVDE